MIYDYCIVHVLSRGYDAPELDEAKQRRADRYISQMMALEFQPLKQSFSEQYDDRYSWTVALRRPSGYTRPNWPPVPLLHLGGWHSWRGNL